MTQLLYLDFPDLFEVEVAVVTTGCDERGNYTLLDKTAYYPQGGGQPADRGEIEEGSHVYSIDDVRSVDGEVRHYSKSDFSGLQSGMQVKLKVDKKRREFHTRYHTASHLLAAIVEGIFPDMKAVKGHQFPGEAYAEFLGILENEELFEKVQLDVNKAIAMGIPVAIVHLSADEVDLPYELPNHEVLRACTIEGFAPVPCGGTHVKNIREIGSIAITKVKSKKGKTKVSYEISS